MPHLAHWTALTGPAAAIVLAADAGSRPGKCWLTCAIADDSRVINDFGSCPGQRDLFGICSVNADGNADVDGDRRRPARANRRTVGAVSTAQRHQGHRAGLHSTSLHRLEATAIFYPNFYPKRQCSRAEMVHLLVTATNWSGRAECVTTLPSWSCGFDSRRPLQFY